MFEAVRVCGFCPTASLGWYFSWHVHVVVYISCNAGIHLPYALICSMPTKSVRSSAESTPLCTAQSRSQARTTRNIEVGIFPDIIPL